MTELEDMENSIWMEFNMKNIPRNEFTVGETKKIIFAQRKAIKEKYQKMKKDRENPKKKEKVELKLHQILNNLDEDASFLKFKESFTKESGVKFENQKFSENEVEGFLDLLKNDEKFKKG
jgi:predicted DNA binding CopG/RHH family protein